MNTTTKQALPRNAALLAGLLERLEAANHSDAAQYRDVEALLNASPAAATVYENLHYENAGLCRSLLDAAAQSELAARDAINRARRPAASPL